VRLWVDLRAFVASPPSGLQGADWTELRHDVGLRGRSCSVSRRTSCGRAESEPLALLQLLTWSDGGEGTGLARSVAWSSACWSSLILPASGSGRVRRRVVLAGRAVFNGLRLSVFGSLRLCFLGQSATALWTGLGAISSPCVAQITGARVACALVLLSPGADYCSGAPTLSARSEDGESGQLARLGSVISLRVARLTCPR
jgi:hypothetical protein